MADFRDSESQELNYHTKHLGEIELWGGKAMPRWMSALCRYAAPRHSLAFPL